MCSRSPSQLDMPSLPGWHRHARPGAGRQPHRASWFCPHVGVGVVLLQGPAGPDGHVRTGSAGGGGTLTHMFPPPQGLQLRVPAVFHHISAADLKKATHERIRIRVCESASQLCARLPLSVKYTGLPWASSASIVVAVANAPPLVPWHT